MAGKRKEIDKNGIFQTRLRELFYKSEKSQEKVAQEIDVARPTFVGWMNGTSLPDINSLIKLVNYFNVSADYLIGLSDTVKADANLRAAMEYTGLSQKAIECLHEGIDSTDCDGEGLDIPEDNSSVYEEHKRKNIITASDFIESKAFEEIIHRIRNIKTSAYIERILTILDDRYSECEDMNSEEFFYASKEDRDVVLENMIYVTKNTYYEFDEEDEEEIRNVSDDALAAAVIDGLLQHKERKELNQFLASKAFNKILDNVIEESIEKAERRFKSK